MWDFDDPLARMKGETLRSHEAFLDYVDMGAGRSLSKLHERYTAISPEAQKQPPSRNLRVIKGWSSKYSWLARLARWQELVNDEREKIRAERVAQLEDADWNNGQALREKVSEFVSELSRFRQDSVQEIEEEDGTKIRIITVGLNATLNQIAQALKIASELQRLSVNEPTENVQLSGAALLTELAHELDKAAQTNAVGDIEQVLDGSTKGITEGD